MRSSGPSDPVQRRAVVERPLDQPERVVVAGDDVEVLKLGVAQRLLNQPIAQQIAGLLGVPELLDPGCQIGQLLFGQGRLLAELLGTLHRRGAVVGPDALQVGVPVRGPRRRPPLGGLPAADSGSAASPNTAASLCLLITAAP